MRRDDYNYYPSNDPFADLGPPSLQRQSVGQNRTLTNAGFDRDISYVKGINQIKAGVIYEQTFLNENDTARDRRSDLQRTLHHCAPVTVNPFPFVAVAGFHDPSQCTGIDTSQTPRPTRTPPTPLLP